LGRARGTNHWAELERTLDEAGISREEFAHVAVEALATSWVSPARDDPSAAFTPGERAVLTGGGFDLSPKRDGEPDMVARTAARLAVIQAKSATVDEVANRLGVSRARVRQRAVERSLYALRDGDEWRFPRWQFAEDGRPIAGLSAVVPAIPRKLHPLAVWRFMSEPSPDLEIGDEPVSPLVWLRTGGDPAPVAAIASDL